jgi:hypothetical protein
MEIKYFNVTTVYSDGISSLTTNLQAEDRRGAFIKAIDNALMFDKEKTVISISVVEREQIKY